MNDYALRAANIDMLLFKGNLKLGTAMATFLGVTYYLCHQGSGWALVLNLGALFVGAEGCLNLVDGWLARGQLDQDIQRCPALAVAHPPQRAPRT